ncbi:SAM-dependent methyltransferase [Lentzea sp. NPDC059081]|uniref:SAM-dependent methyltransferase n=1 Tax=Lentzea sp. NPDC059081 TaxID=3346719 RepID=UPI0036A61D11
MAERVSWVPDGVDTGKPSAARLYDYLLGGGHNFAADRALAEMFLRAQPHARTVARLNRAFLRRAVLFMVQQGIRQFLDLGSGIPTVGNVHEIARKADPESRVVYVDFEEVAVAHSQLILEGDPLATIIQEDMTKPEAVLEAARESGLLDFTRPVGVLTVGVFHFVPAEADPRSILAAYRDAVPEGSYLAFSQFTPDFDADEMAAVVEVMKKSQNPIHPRTKGEIEGLFAGFELVEPGIVPSPLWRPEGTNTDDPDEAAIYAAVGRKV